MESRKRRWPSAKMMSNARVDFPDPESPVTTTSSSRGISKEMFFKLCSLAPLMQIEFEVFSFGFEFLFVALRLLVGLSALAVSVFVFV